MSNWVAGGPSEASGKSEKRTRHSSTLEDEMGNSSASHLGAIGALEEVHTANNPADQTIDLTESDDEFKDIEILQEKIVAKPPRRVTRTSVVRIHGTCENCSCDSCRIKLGLPTLTGPHSPKRAKRTESPAKPSKPESPRGYKCPVCLDVYDPEKDPSATIKMASTTCGHIFHEDCIRDAIRGQKQCPKCRKKLTVKGFHQIFLS